MGTRQTNSNITKEITSDIVDNNSIGMLSGFNLIDGDGGALPNLPSFGTQEQHESD